MSEQLDLFPEQENNYKVVLYFGRMIDTMGDEIYFVRTIKSGMTKFAADELCRLMNRKIFPGSYDYYEVKKL